MVEFGLKLEDNKVDEWSDKYIDYEKLKAVLKRAKGCNGYLDDLLSRSTAKVVAEVTSAHEDLCSDRICGGSDKAAAGGGGTEDGDATPGSSGVRLADADLAAKRARRVDEGRECVGVELTMPLREEKGSSYGSTSPGLKPVTSWGSLNMNSPGLNKIKRYFGLADDRTMLLKAFTELDEELLLFKVSYEKEVEKVDDFYKEKLMDVTERMEILIQSVHMTHVKKRHKNGLGDRMMRRFQEIGDVIVSPPAKKDRGHIMMPSLDFDDEVENDDLLGLGDGEVEDGGEGGESKMNKRIDLVRKADSIKRAIADIYRTAKLLHNFSIMNYTGFVKIAKKFDKTIPKRKGLFKKTICDDGKGAEQLAARMEKMYAKWFCEGDIREAQAQLLTKRGDGLMMDWTQLRLGYRLGMCSILAFWITWDCVWGQFSRGEKTIGGRTAFPVFRACAGLLLLHWFWGMSVYVWTRFRINYIFLFDFDPRIVDTPIAIFNDAVDETLVFLVLMLLYYKAGSSDIPLWLPPGTYPMILIIFTLKCLVIPWKIRKPMWGTIRKVVSAPFVSPTFFMTYVGDVSTSMVKVFQDILWTICFVLSGDWLLSEVSETSHDWAHSFWYKGVAIPLICLCPLVIRFNQCLRRYMDTGERFPHLANAFKYAISQCVTLFGAFHPIYIFSQEHEVAKGENRIGHFNMFQIFWMGLFITSSLYSFCWDVYMDWGIGRMEFGFLGPRLMFPKKAYYYSVMFADLIMRFLWVLTLVPPQSGAKFELPAYLSAISMTVELFRRTLWGFFRMENEHRTNTEGFRRVNIIPLHFNTGHKHKYHERHWVGWKVLGEIFVVTSLVVVLGAFSMASGQRATRDLIPDL